jgi:putative redox protein
MKPPLTVELDWERDLVFSGVSNRARITLDSDGVAGPSPTQALAFALAGCMGVDLVHILRKGRHDLRGVKATLVAQRAPENPHRVTAVDLHYEVTGDVSEAQVQRAIELSHDKYCSVWHSMRQDIAFKVHFTLVRSEERARAAGGAKPPAET